MKVREQAKKFLEMGWSVIPIKAGSKVPSIPWNEFRERYMTPDEVDKHFQEDTNIALVCGKLSGIMVIDQDFYKGDVDLETFKDIDSPLKSVTARGGIHLFYKYKEGTQNTVNEKVKADIRSEGGYVLIAPSKVTHEGKSGSYAWFDERVLETDLAALPEPPKALLEAMYRANPTSESYELPKMDYGALLGQPEGGRNNAISTTSLSLLARGLSEEVAWMTIQSINQGFTPPLPQTEIEKTFQSAVRRNLESPSTSTFGQNKSRASVAAPPELSASVASRTTGDDLDMVMEAIKKGQVRGLSTGYKFLDDTMGGFIPGQSYLLFADTSVGKSMMAVNLLTNLAKEGVESMYFDLENDMQMTLERVMFSLHDGGLTLDKYRKITTAATVDMEQLKDVFAPVTKYKDLFHIWDLNKLMERYGDVVWGGVKEVIEQTVEENKNIKVIVIDHLHYFSPSETDHAYLGEVARQVNNMAAKYHIAIVLLAHTKKGLLETNKKDSTVKAIRPTVDHIAGSGMIAKHFKNIIAMKRNTVAPDILDRTRTEIYVDKTKYGPAGSDELFYCEQSLCFKSDQKDVILAKVRSQLTNEIADIADDTKLPVTKHEKPVTLGEVKAQNAKKVTPEPIKIEKKEFTMVKPGAPVEPPKPVAKDSFTQSNAYDPAKHGDAEDIPF